MISIISIRAYVVEWPWSAPNCLSSNLFATFESILRPTNDSRILLSVGVSEIGRKSSWTDFGGRDFGVGTTFAIFQRLGTQPALIDELNMWQIGSDMANAKFVRTSLVCHLDMQIYDL